MRKIVYYVASSLDGYICGPNADISGFVASGNGVDRYLSDLATFDTVIMGRRTYEFGYRFGLHPGQPAYPHMKHFIFSHSLILDKAAANVEVKPMNVTEIERIQQQPGTDIYLCGGGQFAGWLLDHHKIDTLLLKLNPFIQGQGIRLFGDSKQVCQMQLMRTELFDHGLQITEYSIRYE